MPKPTRNIPVAKPFLDDADRVGVMEVLHSSTLALGPQMIAFEKAIAAYTGAKYAYAVSNGTCGLHLAVRALGLHDGDEVITSPFSFIASSNCLLYERAVPIFADIDEVTYNLTPEAVEAKITSKTKAILAVHIFGQPAEVERLRQIARQHNLALIEDACESLGSTYNGAMSGTLGDIGVYAFYPNKQMTTGEGGMIVTNDEVLGKLCNSLRNQGRNLEGDWLVHERLGYNYRMDEMSAALGVSQLKKLDWMIAEKRKIAHWYAEALLDATNILAPQVGPNRTHTWFVYVVRILNGKRDEAQQAMAKAGIQTKPYLPVIHLQPFMRTQFGYAPGALPVAEKVASQTLALPFYIGLTQEEVHYIVDTLILAAS